MIAHMMGVPAEELVASAMGGGIALIAARAWIIVRLRRMREPGA